MSRKSLVWLVLTFLLGTGIVRAEVQEPEALTKNVTEEVLTILREDKSIQSGNRQRAISLIENKVAPHFDFSRMTSLAVGRGWSEADPAQRKALTDQFHTLLVRTYANALTGYRNQTVTFKPSGKSADDNEVTVRSQIKKPGAQPIPIDYSLHRAEDGWKVFDVSVGGISLVTNYRGSFTSEIKQGGIDGLLKTLQEKNRRLETTTPSAQ